MKHTLTYLHAQYIHSALTLMRNENMYIKSDTHTNPDTRACITMDLGISDNKFMHILPIYCYCVWEYMRGETQMSSLYYQ